MKKPYIFFLVLVLSITLLPAFSMTAAADDDPPGRVARLNYIQGSVSFQPGGETDWVQANPNRPLTTGDNLWTDQNARGELHIDSTAIRLSGQTGISFLNLNDRTVQIQLAQGSLNVHVRRLDGGDDLEIDTPNLAFTVQRPGEYRIDVDPNGQSTNVIVREGEGEATGGGSNFHLDSGESASASGTDTLTFDVGRAAGPDEFDQWCSSRDDREEHTQSARYVSRDVIGYEDLDDYGDWRNVPDYGTVWFPSRVAAGWAPYRFGHWVWIEPWGWTWVEDEPWGFAPFHYGRWAVVGGGWCWVPGPVVVRPVYAPALVAFVGGPRFGLSLSFGGGGGGVAWFPLGPREVYVPGYRASVRYVQNVNVTNTTVNVVNVTNVYNNVNVRNVTYMHQNNVAAVTAVSHDTFVNARPVGAANVRINAQQLQGAEIQRGIAVAPERRSVVGAGAPTTVRPPPAAMRREVVAKQQPAAPPVSFQQRQQALAANPGSAPTQQQMDQLRGQQQQQPNGRTFTPFVRANQNAAQQGNVPQQQPVNPQRGAQVQQQPPAGTFTPPTRGNQNAPQPGSASPQKQVVPQRPQQVQQQPQQPSVQQTQPPVRFAPPARVNEDTYHPHQIEKPQAPAPPPSTKAPEKAPEHAQPQGQQSKKPASGEQERKESH
jgi:uncharacterized protein DUF6600